MIESISNNEITSNSSILQQQDLSGISKKTTANATNLYAKSNTLEDTSNISDNALALYQKDQEMQKYSSMVLDAINKGMSTADIAKLINNGSYQVSNDDLAGSMLQNPDFLSALTSNE